MAINIFMACCALQKNGTIWCILPLKCFCACSDRLTKYMKGILNMRTDEWFKQVHLNMTSYYTHSLCIYGAQTPLGTSSSRRCDSVAVVASRDQARGEALVQLVWGK